MGVRRGGKTGICPPLEIGTKNQKCLVNLKPAAYFRLIDKSKAILNYWAC